ncbi:MAG: Hsp20/alpha crystallin family protein [Desulfobacteraceae bacterium]|nr:Hsp20/alpha crystallin family protein [Desulfobacteraceae bacterium]
MAIIRYPNWLWPGYSSALDDFEKARRHMDRLFSAFTGSGAAPASSGVFPPLIVTEEGDTVIVEAEIPGIGAQDLDISVIGRTLTLSGQRKPDETSDVNFHRRERKWGSFRKALTLPEDVNPDAIKAECRDGVLKIVLPKAESAKPRKIAIANE